MPDEWYRDPDGVIQVLNEAEGPVKRLKELAQRFGQPQALEPLDEVRAPVSGLSGALFALPAACTPDPAEQALWVFQAVVSVLADYVYIGGPSPAHGVDRVLASFNFLRLAFLLSQEAPELFAAIAEAARNKVDAFEPRDFANVRTAVSFLEEIRCIDMNASHVHGA